MGGDPRTERGDRVAEDGLDVVTGAFGYTRRYIIKQLLEKERRSSRSCSCCFNLADNQRLRAGAARRAGGLAGGSQSIHNLL